MLKLKIHILTLFPDLFKPYLGTSILKRAAEKKVVNYHIHDLRDYTHDRHRTCDDKPFGGGPGMVMKPEPVFEATDQLFGKRPKKKGRHFICLTPQGKRYSQKMAVKFSKA